MSFKLHWFGAILTIWALLIITEHFAPYSFALELGLSVADIFVLYIAISIGMRHLKNKNFIHKYWHNHDRALETLESERTYQNTLAQFEHPVLTFKALQAIEIAVLDYCIKYVEGNEVLSKSQIDLLDKEVNTFVRKQMMLLLTMNVSHLNFTDEDYYENMKNIALNRALVEYDHDIYKPDEIEPKIYDLAVKVVVLEGSASTSIIQKNLQIGYSEASQIMDMLEKNGVIGPPNKSHPRKVLSKS